MRALDTTLFALTLVVVPGLAWLTGRAMGRRDWTIAPVLVMSGLVTLLPHLVRLLVLAAFDGRNFDVALFAHFRRAAEALEIGFFFLALGVFMTMLGWTSTPVANRT
jgi:hypothetical protein